MARQDLYFGYEETSPSTTRNARIHKIREDDNEGNFDSLSKGSHPGAEVLKDIPPNVPYSRRQSKMIA